MAQRTAIWLFCPYLFLVFSWAQAAPHRATHRPSADAQPSQYKGILEPVNYGQDINLTDVLFTSLDEGWISGEHATILHTTDGGKTWTAQVGGDPNGTEKPIGQLRFLDAKHGWAVSQDAPQRLLRTMDGENWQDIGQQPERGSSFVDYAFTSVRHGIALGGNMGGFYVTNDGGRHWVNVARCQVRAQVQGLPRTEDCRVQKLQMLSPASGYASADWSGGLAFLRTDDGGRHWTSIVNDVSEGGGPDFFFTDLNHGVMVFNNGRTYLTDDGAKTWHALLSGSVGIGWGQGKMPIHFADPEVGWVIGPPAGNNRTFRLSFSTDGGRHWTTSHNELAFPVEWSRLNFNLARRDRAYVIGDHGMIYRYRIVPTNYTVADSFDAPLMPGVNTAELTAAANRVREDIARLQQQIAAATGGTAPSPAGTTVASGGQPGAPAAAPNSPTSGFTQDASSSGTATQPGTTDASNSAGVTQDSSTPVESQPTTANSSTNVFTQDTGAAAAAFPADPTNANLTQAFTQSVDTSPPSASLQSCCNATLQSLQTNLTGFNRVAATNSAQFRSLNLIIAGVQFVSNLLNQAQQLRASFTALKRAPTLQGASAALQQLSATINSTQQAVSTGFQNQGGWFAQNAPAAFTQDVSTGTSSVVPAMGNAISGGVPQSGSASAAVPAQPAAQAQNAGSNPQQNSAQSAVDQTVNKAKQKIKSKLKWP